MNSATLNQLAQGNMNRDNDSSYTTLTAKYNLLYDNLMQVKTELDEQHKAFKDSRSGQDGLQELIAQRGDQIKDNIELSIQRMDGEIQKSLSHQKAENSRLQQQITQLNTDNTIIRNQLRMVEKRIEEITMQVGNEQLK